ncbi:bacillithiol biosynthesis cysteine-adding enzyme BshC [Candidatus Bipolaricaulota bacterium]|nr:bacillithiol biosynthesis cysteine-adding enzyme BshC [Candidatus Bipolaricaulota bacterium]
MTGSKDKGLDMIERIDAKLLYPQNKFYLDYIAGRGAAPSFFTHQIDRFAEAVDARSRVDYPREAVCDRLYEYNARIASDPTAVLANIADLRENDTLCVISGQQVGLLGGPVYTIYKIITTIRLAASLQERLRIRVVPLFWLADEDHDFTEINLARFLKEDGEVGTVSFEWEERGRPIADLPITDEVLRAYRAYMEALPPSPHHAHVREIFAPDQAEDYSTWHARLFSQIFSSHGLIVLTPSLLREPGRDFLRSALQQRESIQDHLIEAAERLRVAGYEPALSPERAGTLYTADAAGRRIRVIDPLSHLAAVEEYPDRYSPDAALRPLFADALLPIAASVLGPGEIVYHALLKPLYPLFSIPQPLLFPRASYTVLSRAEAKLIARFGMNVGDLLSEAFTVEGTLRSLVPPNLQERFAVVRAAISADLAPLRPLVAALDPNLERSWKGAHATSLHALDRLEGRALRAGLAQHGLSSGALRRLRNIILPRGRPQERVLPLPHFINKYGPGFIDRLFAAGELDDFSHSVITGDDND